MRFASCLLVILFLFLAVEKACSGIILCNITYDPKLIENHDRKLWCTTKLHLCPAIDNYNHYHTISEYWVTCHS